MYNWHDNRKQIHGSVCDSKKRLESLWNAFIAYRLKISQGRTVSHLKKQDIYYFKIVKIDIPLQPSGHYMYRTVVTICTAQWSLYVPPV